MTRELVGGNAGSSPTPSTKSYQPKYLSSAKNCENEAPTANGFDDVCSVYRFRTSSTQGALPLLRAVKVTPPVATL